MIIHSPIISGSLTFAEGATFTLPDNGVYSGSFSGSAQFSTIGSDLIPDTSGAYDLGSEAYPFQDLWLVGNTANIGGFSIGIGNNGFNFKKNSDNSPADLGVNKITIGGPIGSSNSKVFKLNTNNKITIEDENGDADTLEVKELILKDTSGNGKNTKVRNDGGKFTTQEVNDSGTVTSVDSEGSLSGSFTGSVLDLTATGDATFNDAVTVSGLSSLDGGIDVDGVFTVADTSGNVSTTGTLSAGATTLTSTVDVTGLASLDGGIDVDGAFTVADTSGNVSTTGTLSAGATTVTGLTANGNISGSGTLSAGATTLTSTVDVTGLASLDGGIDVDGVFTVADSTGNVSTTGTLAAGNTTITGTVDASGLISADGGLDVDGAFTVADTTGNVSTSGTLSVTGLTTVGIISGSNGDFTGNLSVGGNLTVAGAMTNDGHIIPALHNTYDLGSTEKYWRDLYLSSGSLYINGNQVLSTDGTDLLIQTDAGESVKILEGGSDTITLETANGDITLTSSGTGNIELDAPIQIAAGRNILSSDGNAITFANDVNLGSNDIFAANLVGVVSSSAIQYDGNNITVLGNLTVQGTQTQLNTATLNIEDKNLLIASGAVDSAAANGAGITIDGADVTFNWDSNGTKMKLSSDLEITNGNLHVDTLIGSGGDVAIQSTHTFSVGAEKLRINETAVTSTAAELNLVDGSSAGTVVNSKAVVYGAAGEVNATTLQIDGTSITSTATELNQLDGNTVGGTNAGDIVTIDGTQTLTNKTISAAQVTEISSLTADEGAQLENIDSVTISNTQWGYLGAADQGIATTDNVTFATVSATGDIVAYASSDERLKDNIEVISNPIEKVEQLKGVTWDWNDNADELQKSLPNVGVIAQDVEKVLPQLVKTKEDGYKAVDYDKIVGLLIEAIKTQQNQIDSLERRLEKDSI